MRSAEFDSDYGFQAAYIPQVKRLLGEALLREGDPIEDALEATDLIVLHLDGVRIGCRVRRHQYFKRYAGEFTLRGRRPSGTATELEKVLDGWGDYLFYGFASEAAPGRLRAARLIDLGVFRWWWGDHRGLPPGVQWKPNSDGSSEFVCVEVVKLPSAAVRMAWGL